MVGFVVISICFLKLIVLCLIIGLFEYVCIGLIVLVVFSCFCFGYGLL